jgi:hypothetical protein
MLDSIIGYALIKEKYGYVEHKLNIEENLFENGNLEIPIRKHKKGYYLASRLLYNKDKDYEYVESIKKRWDNKHDELSDFGKSKRQVTIRKGEFKSGDYPINVHTIKDVWFYFYSDYPEYVKRLIDDYIPGIGYKTAIGYGEIDNISLEEINYNPFKNIIRPIPTRFFKEPLNNKISYTGWKPPYWEHENWELCYV